jgi:hypothetical protein
VLARSQANSGWLAWYPSAGRLAGYIWRKASSSSSTVLTAQVASSFWLAGLRVAGLELTAIGARSGLTARSSRLSQTLLHSSQIASSSVTFRAGIEPTRRRWPGPSSRASTLTGPLISKLRRAHFGITCSQVILPFVVPQKTHAFVPGAGVAAWADMAEAYVNADRLDGSGIA